MRVFALLALCIAAAAAVPSNPQRIVGGSVTTIETWPQMASLLYSWNLVTYSQTCGGSILNNRAILTAAHCTIGDAANRWRSRVGSTWANSGGVVHNTASIINHPSYNSRTYDNDISIIRTATTIVHNNAARPASIAGANYNLGDNQVVWATGWGATSELALGQCKRDRSHTQAHKFLHPVEGCDTGQVQGGSLSEQLRQVQIWTVNQNVCNQRYGGAITANMLCSGWLDVGGRDQCQGDSGGPLYHNGVVVGVCSWGNGCAQAFFPGVNARVSRFTAWIQSNA